MVRPEGLGKLKKSSDIIGNRTRDFAPCSIVAQQLGYRVPHLDSIRNVLPTLQCVGITMIS
jgi:hypothetical protein